MTRKRELSDDERRMLNKLLEKPFPGRDELARQIEKAVAVPIDDGDDCGSIRLITQETQKAAVNDRVPVWGSGSDVNGEPVEVLLHVIDGRVDELEVVLYGDSPKVGRIDPESLEVTTRD